MAVEPTRMVATIIRKLVVIIAITARLNPARHLAAVHPNQAQNHQVSIIETVPMRELKRGRLYAAVSRVMVST